MQSGEMEPSTSCIKQELEIICPLFLIAFFVTDYQETLSTPIIVIGSKRTQMYPDEPFIFLFYTSDLNMEEETPDLMPKVINKTKIQENQNMLRRGVLEGLFKHLLITDRHSDYNNEPPELVFRMAYFY